MKETAVERGTVIETMEEKGNTGIAIETGVLHDEVVEFEREIECEFLFCEIRVACENILMLAVFHQCE